MRIEISRKQFMEILTIVDNDAQKADQICKIIEGEDTKQATRIVPSNEGQGQNSDSTFTPETPPMNGFGKNVRRIGGITE